MVLYELPRGANVPDLLPPICKACCDYLDLHAVAVLDDDLSEVSEPQLCFFQEVGIWRTAGDDAKIGLLKASAFNFTRQF